LLKATISSEDIGVADMIDPFEEYE
jgi:hypothetical protein